MQSISRRKFVVSLSVLGGALSILPFVADADDAPTTTIYWANVGDAKTFPVNVPTLAAYPPQFGPGSVYVTRADDKTVSALLPKCTHHGCTVAFDSTGDVFNCPCHHAQFAATGAVLQGPARRPLLTLQAKIDSGSVWVQSLVPPH